MKYLNHKPISTIQKQKTQLTIVCPACSGEVTLAEMIEKKGSLGCINCIR